MRFWKVLEINKIKRNKLIGFTIILLQILLICSIFSNDVNALHDDNNLDAVIHGRFESNSGEINSNLMPVGFYDFFDSPDFDTGDIEYDITSMDVSEIQKPFDETTSVVSGSIINATGSEDIVNSKINEYEVSAGIDTVAEVNVSYMSDSFPKWVEIDSNIVVLLDDAKSIEWDGDYYWVVIENSNTIYKFSESWSYIGSDTVIMPHSQGYVEYIKWNGTHWFLDNDTTSGSIFIYDSDFSYTGYDVSDMIEDNYYASYEFDDQVGLTGTELDIWDACYRTHSDVHTEFQGRDYVYHGGTDQSHNHFYDNSITEEGLFEFYMYLEDGALRNTAIETRDDDYSVGIKLIFMIDNPGFPTHDKEICWYSNFVYHWTGIHFDTDKWYHVKLKLDVGTYGDGTNDYHLWLDNVSIDGGAGFGYDTYMGYVPDDMTKFVVNGDVYLDAVGMSPDENYHEGDNRLPDWLSVRDHRIFFNDTHNFIYEQSRELVYMYYSNWTYYGSKEMDVGANIIDMVYVDDGAYDNEFAFFLDDNNVLHGFNSTFDRVLNQTFTEANCINWDGDYLNIAGAYLGGTNTIHTLTNEFVFSDCIATNFTYDSLGIVYSEMINMTYDSSKSILGEYYRNIFYRLDSSMLNEIAYGTSDFFVSDQYLNINLVPCFMHNYTYNMSIRYTSGVWQIPSDIDLKINDIEIIDSAYNSGYAHSSEFFENLTIVADEYVKFELNITMLFRLTISLEIISRTYLKKVFELLTDHGIIIERIDLPLDLQLKKVYLNNVDLGDGHIILLSPEMSMDTGNVFSLEVITGEEVSVKLPYVGNDNYGTLYSEFFGTITSEMTHIYSPDGYRSTFIVSDEVNMLNEFPNEQYNEDWSNWDLYNDDYYTESSFNEGNVSSDLQIYDNSLYYIGHYPASYNSFVDEVGETGLDIEFVDDADHPEQLEIVPTAVNHDEVLSIKFESPNVNIIKNDVEFGEDTPYPDDEVNSQNLQFWIMMNDTKDGYFRFDYWGKTWTDPDYELQSNPWFGIWSEKFRYTDYGDWKDSGITIQNNTWYHVSIHNDGYIHRFRMWVYEPISGLDWYSGWQDYDGYNSMRKLERAEFVFSSYNSKDVNYYIDAVGSDWENDGYVVNSNKYWNETGEDVIDGTRVGNYYDSGDSNIYDGVHDYDITTEDLLGYYYSTYGFDNILTEELLGEYYSTYGFENITAENLLGYYYSTYGFDDILTADLLGEYMSSVGFDGLYTPSINGRYYSSLGFGNLTALPSTYYGSYDFRDFGYPDPLDVDDIGTTGFDIEFVDDGDAYDGGFEIIESYESHYKILRMIDDIDAGEDPRYLHDLSERLPNGIVEFWLCTDDVDEDWQFLLYEESNIIIHLRIGGGASELRYKPYGGGWNTISAVSNDTWYQIRIEWRSDDKFDVYVDGVKLVDNVDTRESQVIGIDMFRMTGYGDSEDCIYLDQFEEFMDPVHPYGYYYGIGGFNDEIVGTTGIDIDFVDSETLSGGSGIEIIKSSGVHKNVLNFTQDDDGEWNWFDHDMDSTEDAGIIEFWWKTDETDQGREFQFMDGGSPIGLFETASSSLSIYKDSGVGGTWELINPLEVDTWYHVRYQWFSDDTNSVWIDGELIVDGEDMYNDMTSGIDRFRAITDGDHIQYFDAFGNVSGTTYYEGNNYNPYDITELISDGWKRDDLKYNISLNIESYVDGHYNVMKLRDDNDVEIGLTQKYLGSSATYGTVEFWTKVDSTDIFYFDISGSSSLVDITGYYGGTWRFHDGSDWIDTGIITTTNWTHHRIDFECSDSGYKGLSQYTFDWYIDGFKISDCDGHYSPYDLNRVRFYTGGGTPINHNYYIDAIGYSWDTTSHDGIGYETGYNLNPFDVILFLDVNITTASEIVEVFIDLEFGKQYPASFDYSFTNDIGKTGTDISWVDYGSATEVIPYKDGHSEVMEIKSTGGAVHIKNYDPDRWQASYVDYWFMVNNSNGYFAFSTEGEGGWEKCRGLTIREGTFQYWNGVGSGYWVDTGIVCENNTWYHTQIFWHVIHFAWDYEYDLWLDGVQIADDAEYYSNGQYMEYYRFRVDGLGEPMSVWIDSIGHHGQGGYAFGDNELYENYTIYVNDTKEGTFPVNEIFNGTRDFNGLSNLELLNQHVAMHSINFSDILPYYIAYGFDFNFEEEGRFEIVGTSDVVDFKAHYPATDTYSFEDEVGDTGYDISWVDDMGGSYEEMEIIPYKQTHSEVLHLSTSASIDIGNTDMNTRSGDIEFYFMLNNTNAIFQFIGATGMDWLRTIKTDNGKFYYWEGTGTGGGSYIDTGVPCYNNTWYHYRLHFDSAGIDSYDVYINGTLLCSNARYRWYASYMERFKFNLNGDNGATVSCWIDAIGYSWTSYDIGDNNLYTNYSVFVNGTKEGSFLANGIFNGTSDFNGMSDLELLSHHLAIHGSDFSDMISNYVLNGISINFEDKDGHKGTIHQIGANNEYFIAYDFPDADGDGSFEYWQYPNNLIHGHYPATYSFEDDTIGGIPTGWTDGSGSNTYTQVKDRKDRHKNIVELYDYSASEQSAFYQSFSTQTYGSIEFWIMSTEATKQFDLALFGNGGATIRGYIYLDIDKWRYWDGTFHDIDVGTPINNVWYHISIHFEFTTGGYRGLSQNKWKMEVNGRETGELTFDSYVDIDKIEFSTQSGDSDFLIYIDAIGYSWDPDYNVGDNLEPLAHYGIIQATYNFEDDSISSSLPSGWTSVESGSAYSNVIDGVGNIGKVVELVDHDASGYVSIRNAFPEQTNGVVEWWARAETTNGQLVMALLDLDITNTGIYVYMYQDGLIKYRDDGGVVSTGYSYSTGTWYHFRVEWDLNVNGNFYLWINGESIDGGSGYDQRGSPVDIDRLLLTTALSLSTHTYQFGGFGYNWTDYEIGDNLKYESGNPIGMYNASYSFIDDVAGGDPFGWIAEENGAATVNVIEMHDTHTNVVEIYDDDGVEYAMLKKVLPDITSGTVECWVNINGIKPLTILLGDDGGTDALKIHFWTDGNIRYYDDASPVVIMPYETNKWYHFKIEFDCSTDWHLWIDGVSMDGGSGFVYAYTPIEMDRLLYWSSGTDSGYSIYIDAVGFSWLDNYTIGDNLHESYLYPHSHNEMDIVGIGKIYLNDEGYYEFYSEITESKTVLTSYDCTEQWNHIRVDLDSGMDINIYINGILELTDTNKYYVNMFYIGLRMHDSDEESWWDAIGWTWDTISNGGEGYSVGYNTQDYNVTEIVDSGWSFWRLLYGSNFNITEELDGHSDVFTIQDNVSSSMSYSGMDYQFGSQPYGYLEFWIRTTDATERSMLDLDGKSIFYIVDDKFKYYDGTLKDIPSTPTPLDDTWYHVRWVWETTTGGYDGLEQGKCKFNINGMYSGAVDMISYGVAPELLAVATDAVNSDMTFYIDAIGFYWDNDYIMTSNTQPYNITDLYNTDYSFYFVPYVDYQIVNEDGHSDVLKIDDQQASADSSNCYQTDLGNIEQGTIELWMKVSDVDNQVELRTYSSGWVIPFRIRTDSNKWYYDDGVNWQVIPNMNDPQDNVWYHVRIDWNILSDTYNTVEQNKFRVYIDGCSSGDLDLINNYAVNFFSIYMSTYQTGYQAYFDAIGYSWDESSNFGRGYNVGYNIPTYNFTEILDLGFDLTFNYDGYVFVNSSFIDGHSDVLGVYKVDVNTSNYAGNSSFDGIVMIPFTYYGTLDFRGSAYPDTFDSDEVGEILYVEDNDWIDYMDLPSDASISIEEEFDGRRNVLTLIHGNSVDDPYVYHYYDSYETIGAREFWWGTSDITKNTHVNLFNNSDSLISLQILSSTYQYYDGASWQDTTIAPTNDVLDNHKIFYDCETDTFDWYINDVKVVFDGDFDNNGDYISKIRLLLSSDSSVYSMYFDGYANLFDESHPYGVYYGSHPDILTPSVEEYYASHRLDRYYTYEDTIHTNLTMEPDTYYSSIVETVGTTGNDINWVDWSVLDDGGCEIISSWQSHNVVLRLTDDITPSQDPYAMHLASTVSEDGSVEFWFGSDDVTTGDSRFSLYDLVTAEIVYIRLYSDELQYFDSSDTWQKIDDVVDDTWYHIRIDWRSDDTFDLYLSGVKVVDNQITNNIMSAGVSRMYLRCYGDTISNAYLNGWGNIENDNYSAGYNINPYNITSIWDTPFDILYLAHSSHIKITDEVVGHEDVLELYDGIATLDNDNDRVGITTSYSPQTTGTVEFWVRGTDVTDYLNIYGWTTGGDVAFRISFSSDDVRYYYDAGWHDATNSRIYNDVWYHCRVDFDCVSGTYDFYLDGNLLDANIDFKASPASINQFSIHTGRSYNDYTYYIDAIGFSWDPDYDIGDNNISVFYAMEPNIYYSNVDNFDEEIGETGLDISWVDETGNEPTDSEVVNRVDDHVGVLIQNDTASGLGRSEHYFPNGAELNGSREFWIRPTETDKDSAIHFCEGFYVVRITIEFGSDGNLKYYDSTHSSQIIQAYTANVWYHFNVIWTENTGMDTFDLYVDGVLVVDDGTFYDDVTGSGINRSMLSAYDTAVYLDAWSNPLYDNYTSGDNINPYDISTGFKNILGDLNWCHEGHMNVSDDIYGRDNVLVMYDPIGTRDDLQDHLQASIDFGDVASGSFELWFRLDDVTNELQITLANGDVDNRGLRMMIDDDKLQYYYSSTWNDATTHPISDNTWHYLFIEWEAGAVDTYDVSIDSALIDSNIPFMYSSFSEMNKLVVQTGRGEQGYTTYVSDVCFSWDPNYDMGLNLNPYDLTELSEEFEYIITGYSSHLRMTPIVGNHTNVLEIYDGASTSYVSTYDIFDVGQTSTGTVEFWVMGSDVSDYLNLYGWGDGGVSFRIGVFGDKFRYYTSSGWGDATGGTAVDNEWYHVRIDFDFSAGNYDFYLDGVLLDTDIDFQQSPTDLDYFVIATGAAYTDYTYYFDAIGYSWDDWSHEGRGYTTSYNLNPYNVTHLNNSGIDYFHFGINSDISIVDYVDGHSDVVAMHDGSDNLLSNYDYLNTMYDFSSVQSSGSIEFWVRSDDVTDNLMVCVYEDYITLGIYLIITADKIQYYYSAGWHDATGGGLSDDTWYHFRIEFDCATDTYNFYLDGVLLDADIPYNIAIDDTNRMNIKTGIYTYDYTYYIDAIGYSWDTTSHGGLGYTQGYNLNSYDIEPLLNNSNFNDIYFGQSSYIKFTGYVDGHNDVIELYDGTTLLDDGNDEVGVSITTVEQTTGIIEFWVRGTDTTDGLYVQIRGDAGLGVYMLVASDKIQYYYSGWNDATNGDVYDDRWYHFSLHFDCTTDTYDFYLDGFLLDADIPFQVDQTYLNDIEIKTVPNYGDYTYYIDAIGFDWDLDYVVGDNLFPNSDYLEITNNFTEQNDGNIEFWIRTEDTNNFINIYFDDSIYIRIYNETIHFESFGQEIGFTNNTWYHVRIYFDCITDTYDFYLDADLIAEDVPFIRNAVYLSNYTFSFGNYSTSSNCLSYIDAIGETWDNYSHNGLGYNLTCNKNLYNFTGLLEYDMTFAIDSFINVTQSVDGHSDVLTIVDNAINEPVSFIDNFESQSSGSIELWIRSSDTADEFKIFLRQGGSNRIKIRIKDDKIEYDYSSGWTTIAGGSVSDNKWYHIRIDFDTSDDKFDFYLNGTLLESDLDFDVVGSYIDSLYISTDDTGIGNYYADAIGYSWDNYSHFGRGYEAGFNTNLYNFTGLLDEGYEIDFIPYCFVNITEDVDGHTNVLTIYDNNTESRTGYRTYFSSQVNGTVEYWLRGDMFATNWYSFILHSGVSVGVNLSIDGDSYLWYDDGTLKQISGSFLNPDTWYHVRIDFECSSGGYMGLSEDTFDIYLDTILIGEDLGFQNDIDSVSYYAIYTSETDDDYTLYIDAIGYSWNESYDIYDSFDKKVVVLAQFNLSTLLDFNSTSPVPLESLSLVYSYDTDSSQVIIFELFNASTSEYILISSLPRVDTINKTRYVIPNIDLSFINGTNIHLRLSAYNTSTQFQLMIHQLEIYYNWTMVNGDIYSTISKDIEFPFMNRYDSYDEYQKLYNMSISFNYTFTNYTSYDYFADFYIGDDNYSLIVDGDLNVFTLEYVYNSSNTDVIPFMFNITNGLLEISFINYTFIYNCLMLNGETGLYQYFRISPVINFDVYEQEYYNIFVNFTYNFTTQVDGFNYYNEIGSDKLVIIMNITTDGGTNLINVYEHDSDYSGVFSVNLREILDTNLKTNLLGFSIGTYLIGNNSYLEIDDLYVHRKYERKQIDLSPRTDQSSVRFHDYLVADRVFNSWYIKNNIDIETIELENIRTEDVVEFDEIEVNNTNYFFEEIISEDDVVEANTYYEPEWDVSYDIIENSGTYTKIEVHYKADLNVINVTIVLDLDPSIYGEDWSYNATQDLSNKLEIPSIDFTTTTRTLILDSTHDIPDVVISSYESDQSFNRLTVDTEIDFSGYLSFPRYTESFQLDVEEEWDCYKVYYGNESYALQNTSKTSIFVEGDGFNPTISDSYLHFRTEPFEVVNFNYSDSTDVIQIKITSTLDVDNVYFRYYFNPDGAHDLEVLRTTNSFNAINVTDTAMEGQLTFHSDHINEGTTIITIFVNFTTPLEMLLQSIFPLIAIAGFVGLYYYLKNNEEKVAKITSYVEKKIIPKIEKIKKEDKGLENAVIEIKDNKIFIESKK